MIVKNEEVMLEDALKSIQDVDEIVICDTGSTDKTIEIAKKYTDKVFTDYTWNDNFAEARNHANSKCTSDWILVIDADETLEEGGVDRIRKEIEKAGSKCMAINLVVKGKNRNNRFNFPRLYRNSPDVKWLGAIHNRLNVQGTHNTDITVTYGYSPAHKNDPNRALRILTKVCKENPDCVREKFYLAREYIYKKDWKKAIKWYKKYIKVSKWAVEKSEAYFRLAYAYWYSQQGELARDACLQALKINTNFREAIELMAEMTGPINRKRWIEFAVGADNSKILFDRSPTYKGSEYYDKLFEENTDMSRYNAIYEKIANMVGKRDVLDIGCGLAELSTFLKPEQYCGFDFSAKTISGLAGDVWVEDATKVDYTSFGNFDYFICTEVLEHADDYAIITRIPSGQKIIFSVPSFKDPSHVRIFTEAIIRSRYRGLIDIKTITRFNWIDKKWVEGKEDTPEYILLVEGVKI